jgi:ribonuclease D
MTRWIASEAELGLALADVGANPVALDTEFIREKTYYAQLALVQVAVAGTNLLIDPLALQDAAPLRALLAGPMLKLMHSPSEDLQALKHRYGVLPRPLFDTQAAAALCGLGSGLGYQALIEKLLGVRLEKGETRSDWLRRPLSESQLRYAADDVLYLGAAHAQLATRLRELGREHWLAEECERQLANAEDDSIDALPHLESRSAQRMRPEQQWRLRRLLIWREQQARQSDKPKSWVLDNELTVELALTGFAQRHDFDRLLDARPRAPRKLRDELWDEVTRPFDSDERALPLAEAPDPRWREPLKRMQQAVALVAAEQELPEGLLCARRHLEALIAQRRWPKALEGWRLPLLEPALAPLIPVA